VLRKIMRRAMRHGKKLGLTEPFLHELTGVVIAEMAGAYPELDASREAIVSVVHREETQFDRVLRDGLPHLEAALADAESMQRILDGEAAFRLYDTFGMPLDFIEDMAQSRSVDFDEKGFEGAMEEQRTRARAGATFGGDRAQVDIVSGVAGIHFDPESFVGYETTSATSVVTHIFRRNDSGTTLTPVDVLNAAEEGHVVLETTPFYLEAGGQVSDTGRLFRDGAVEANVRNIERIQPGWPRMHVIAVRDGTLRVGDKVEAEVDAERRDAIRRNHTATHLLHAALRQIVGTHVKQKGSLVAPDRLRFDISHHEAVTPDQLTEIELLVNEHVFMTNQTVETEERSTEEARAAGAIALFGEKYGERVRVVTVPGFSVELCGGTHCRATGDIGPFVITHEGGVAAGVRRIEAVTGAEAVQLFQGRGDQAAGLDTLADRAVASVHTLDNLRFRRPVNASRAQKALEAVNKLAKRAKDLERENERLKVQAAMGAGTSQGDDFDVHEVLGIQVVARRVSSMDPGALRTLADSRRDRLGSGVVVMACDNGGKAALVASVTPDVADRVPAGKLVKELAPIVGGRGGGRPDFAQAGGREVDRINSIVPQCYTAITRMLDEDS
jgi:alanyl-tRNA synthetase